MKKILLLSLTIWFAHTISGQITCEPKIPDSKDLRHSGYIYNGDIFTPKGDLRVLRGVL